MTPRAASALSRHDEWRDAAEEVAAALARGPAEPELVLLLATDHHTPRLAELAEVVRGETGARQVVACTGLGVLSEAAEVEEAPGLAALALGPDAPGLAVAAPRGKRAEPRALGRDLGEQLAAREPRAAVLLASPDAGWPEDLQAGLIDGLGRAVPIFGAGLSSAEGYAPRVVVDGQDAAAPAIALGLVGGRPDQALSAAWSPRGAIYRVTRAAGTRIHELDGRPARDVLAEAVGAERLAAIGGASPAVLIGLPVEAGAQDLRAGGYLIRNLVGVHPRTGALLTSSPFALDTRLGFVVRDVADSRAHLDRVLGELAGRWPDESPAWGIYFDCCARGRDFYGEEGVDTALLRARLPGLPVVGLFGAYELAPLGDGQPVHGYTGVLLVAG